jgi:hypothetical protein
MPGIPKVLDFIATNLPWTPIGRGILAAREQEEMKKYRQLMMSRQQQELDTQQQQMTAAQNVFKPGAPHPEQIPITPQVGSPGYDQTRQQLDQTQIGTASPVDYLKGPQSAIARGLAAAGQFDTAGQFLKENAPQMPQWKEETIQGLPGQRNVQTGKFDPFPQQSTAATKDTFRQMTPEQLRQWGFPEGTVAALSATTGKPDVIYRPDIRERADLEQKSSKGEIFLNQETGDMVAGEYESGIGNFYRDSSGKKIRIDPAQWRPTTPSTGGLLTPKQFLDLREKFTQEQQALQRLNKYGESVGGMNVGLRNWADSVSAKFRTMLGSKELNPAEFARMTGEGQLQALLGLFRTDVVGPGVMTEYDAQRVMQALGGNVGPLQNPQVVAQLLSDIYANKMERVKIYQSEIERNRPGFKTGEMPITAPSEFGGTGAPPSPGQGLSPEEQAELEQLRRELGGK